MVKFAYNISLITSGVLYVLFWFAPYADELYSEETQQLLAYSGFGAMIEYPMWYWWAYLGITIAAYIGMLFKRKYFRLAFLAVIVIGLAMQPTLGVNITPGIFLLMVDTSTLLQGFALGLAYFSTISVEFK